MNSVVVLKMVPDVVEELEIAADGRGLDADLVRLIASESDEHALEQALLLKEREGGRVTVVALSAPDVDDVLFTALAKGADRAVRIDAEADPLDIRQRAAAVATWMREAREEPDLLLTGTQAIDDLRGLAVPWLAHLLGWPSVGIVTSVSRSGGGITVTREFPWGVRGRFSLPLPAVVGIQAAEKPPRYVPVAKVRAVMKAHAVEAAPVEVPEAPSAVRILEVAKRAQMLEGEPDAQAAQLVGILVTRGLA
jgi:electron transfer flavoprotein beta subunit